MRFVLALAIVLALGLALPVQAASGGGWPAFASDFVQEDGRVVDHEAASVSTSEGQVYALFFALVAGDRERFERILLWTQNNLAGGDLEARTMAWKWGQSAQGNWEVLDANAASDADLWLAYVLFEAGRLWDVPVWRLKAQTIQARVAAELVRVLPSGGAVLLPGPQGFTGPEGALRLNPSYVPLPLLRALQREVPDGPWRAVAESLPRQLKASPSAVAPDWLVWTPQAGFALGEGATVGSYDAIRVYLWAGMTSEHDALRRSLLRSLSGVHRCVDAEGWVAEKIDARSGDCVGRADAGFVWAMLPMLVSEGRMELAAKARRTAAGTAIGKRYYPRVLALFAESWLNGCYRFDAEGRLLLSRGTGCV